MEFNVAAVKAHFTLSNTRNASLNLLNIHQHWWNHCLFWNCYFLYFMEKKNVLSNVKACFKTTVFYINMNNNRNITCTNFVDVNIDLNLHSNEEN